MDSYSTERKVSDFPEADLSDMLDNEMDIFDTPQANIGLDQYSMDNDWLDRFFEDDPILNDKMMSEALHPPQVRSDHSYSLSNGESGRDSPLNLCKADMDKELDLEFLTTAVTQAPNMTAPSVTQPSTPSVSSSPVPGQSLLIKREPVMHTDTATANLTMTTQVPCTSATTSNLVKQPTIILTTQAPVQHTVGRQERLVLPKVNIKVEPTDSADETMSYDGLGLPPTPPSSTNSDSEGSLSPQRSAPSSPIRHNPLARPQPSAAAAVHTITQQPLFTSPIPQSGVLILTEEEKRTLIAEGYPIPNKLPLTKQEEKNLKKIRRKIKNKISAQESRRKKKEYLESLERRVEGFSQENNDLKKKVEQLENNNRSLLGQLQKLQSLVSKVPRPSSASSTQTGTCLMVLVLCFAIFLGSWSPLNFSIGYSSTLAPPVVKTPVTKIPMQSPMGPEVKDARVDAYTTPNMRSRVLLSMKEEQEEGELYGPHTPFSYRDMFVRLFTGGASDDHSAAMEMEPPIPRAHVMAEEVKVNETVTSTRFKATPAVMHPDIAANVTAKVVSVDNRLNTTS